MRTHNQLTRYQHWLKARHGLAFDSYDALWQWSASDLEAFWASVWDYFGVQSPTPYLRVLGDARMPGARWFAGAQVNYARQVLRHADLAHGAGQPALVWADEAMLQAGQIAEVSWPELQRQVGALALALRGMGVQPGDRVAAVLPNTPATVVAFLATVSLGAIWSLCSPDMGPVAILDRFSQIEPQVLIACDGYPFGAIAHDRQALLAQVLAGLPSVTDFVRWTRVAAPQAIADVAARPVHDLPGLLAGSAVGYEPPWLPFDHPLWIVYSSGTTGLPKPIVHGHGGVIIESLKGGALGNDCAASVENGERVFWNSSTTWIVWNGHIASLLAGTTVCLFEGNAAGRMVDAQGQRLPADWLTLWRFAALSRASYFGAGSAFFASCQKAGAVPQQAGNLQRVRTIAATGSPLTEDSFRWLWDQLPRRADGQPVWLNVISGGTDVACAFVGGVPGLSVVAGEMQGRSLGVAVAAYSQPDAQGRAQALIDEVGELVVTRPMPSMPLYFWADPHGRRYHDSYFDMYPGIWRHGDWLRIVPHPQLGAAGSIIYGRSDATINRHGIRMGTSELYRAVEALPEVLDSLVVDLEYLGRASWMPLFVVLQEGLALDDALRATLKAAVRQALSPRHVPDDIYQVAAIPRTLSGKKMELPVRKLLLGAQPDAVLKRDAMANAHSIDWFVTLAQARAAQAL